MDDGTGLAGPGHARLFLHRGRAPEPGGDRGGHGITPAALARSLAAWWPPLLAVTLLAAVLAWYCWRRHRRYYQPASAVWFVFVLLTGVPGLVAYLFHRRWPVLEKCPACGQVVPATGKPAPVRRGVSRPGTQGLRSVRVKTGIAQGVCRNSSAPRV